jgi:branched-chain amino acid transport system ATP-binding protein
MAQALSVEKLNVKYGNVTAIKNVSLYVDEGELVTLIGANGAGKTTTLLSIIGALKVASGTICFKGKDITKMRSHKRVEAGISLVPEGRRIFPDLTVYENMEMGAFTRKDKKKIKEDIEKYFDLVPQLKDRSKQFAGNLSGGEQQMLAISRSLMSNPSLLLLDEPSLGLAPLVIEELFGILKEINKSGTTILLVEQNARKALSISDRAYVLVTGKMVMEGKAEEILKDEKVADAFLGG